MKIYKPPLETPEIPSDQYSIFLAGSIDMGAAEDWQAKLETDLSEIDDLVIFNPRRDDWDSSSPQDPTPGSKFHEQVTWELDHIDKADLVVLYFADDSMSPITLLEFGYLGANLDKNVIIYCTDKFYRYGNVRIFADRQHIPIFDNYEDFLTAIKQYWYSPSNY